MNVLGKLRAIWRNEHAPMTYEACPRCGCLVHVEDVALHAQWHELRLFGSWFNS